MGQPMQGGAQGQSGPQVQGTRRPGPLLWFLGACLLTLVVLVVLGVGGGAMYVIGSRSGAVASDEPADPTTPPPVTFSHEAFSFSYPAEWADLTERANESGAGVVAQIASADVDPTDLDENAADSITVYLFASEFHAVMTCRTQAIWTGFGWDESGDPEELEPVELGGRELPAHRTLGTHEGQDVVGEMYCADVGDEVVQIVVESHGGTELSPRMREVLDSWRWADA